MSAEIDTAVLLAAGEGTRLRHAVRCKPLCPVAGTPLIGHAIANLAVAGIARAVIVTGYGADELTAYLASRSWPLRVETVHNPQWRLPNGVSALAARPAIGRASALLAMGDHLVEPALYRRVLTAGAGNGLRLGVDRRLGHPFVDPEDVTRVRTDGARIEEIGKGLELHDAYDTGVFAVGEPFFEALAVLPAPSITDAVRALARNGEAHVVDCSGFDWIDVDDGAALAIAEELLRSGAERKLQQRS